jgi:hypothetical protein
MTVNDLNRICICDRDMVWLDSDYFPETLVRLIYSLVSPSSAALVHKP